MTGHVFISYAWADGHTYAEKLEHDLQTAGFSTWRDTRNISPDQDFTAEIEKAIEPASHVVVCMTPDIKRDNSFVRREIQYALLLKKPIIPLQFADILPPIHIINRLWIDFHKQAWEQAFAQLQTRLKQPDTVTDAPAAPTDPYRDYLKALYDQIIAYLQQTVFALSTSLVELRSESSPDAVQTVQKQALPLAFFGQAGIDTQQTEHKHFASFHEAFDFYQGRILLLGDPGAGKTTTLLSFARDAVWKRLEDPSLPLPIIAPIATWDAQQQTPLVDWIAGQIPLLKRNDLASLVVDGKTLLALDGLDELGGERENPATKERFDPRLRFLNLLPTQNQVVISCRIKDYGEIGQKAALKGAVTLHALNDEQMRNYIIDQPDLWAALEADDGLRDMARTPLLLSLFAYAFKGLDDEAKKLHSFRGGELRDKIFETYVRRRYEYEARKRPLAYSLDEMTTALRYGAFRGISRENVLFSIGDGAITHDWESPDDIEMGDFVNLNGMDVTLDAPVAMLEIGRRMQATQPLLDQARLLHILLPVGKRHYRFIHLLLRDYFAFPEALAALTSAQDKERIMATQTLRKIGDLRAVEPIITLLSAPDKTLRRTAVEALGQLKDTRAVEPLIALFDDSSRSVRRRVAEILGSMSDEQAVGALIRALKDSDNTVIVYAAMSLKKIGTPEALAALDAWRREIPSE